MALVVEQLEGFISYKNPAVFLKKSEGWTRNTAERAMELMAADRYKEGYADGYEQGKKGSSTVESAYRDGYAKGRRYTDSKKAQ